MPRIRERSLALTQLLIDLCDDAGLEVVSPRRARAARRHRHRLDARPRRLPQGARRARDRLRLPARSGGRRPARRALLQHGGRGAARGLRARRHRREPARTSGTPARLPSSEGSPATNRGPMDGVVRRLRLARCPGPGAQRRVRRRALDVGDRGRLPVGDDVLRRRPARRRTPPPPCRSRCRSAESTTRTILVRGAQKVSVVSPTIDSPLQLNLFFAHYVSVDGKAVPDALMPWDGSQRATEQNEPAALAPGDRALRHGSGRLQRLARSSSPTGRGLPSRSPSRSRRSRCRSRTRSPAACSRPSTSRRSRTRTRRRALRRRAGLDTAGPLQLPRLVPALAEQLGLRQPERGLRLHERQALVARQVGADDRRRPASPASSPRCGSRSRTTAGARAPTSAAGRPTSRRRGARTSGPCTGSGRTTAGSARTRTCTGWTSPGRRASGPSGGRRR